MNCDEAEIETARRAILQAAQEMLAGRLSYIAGARKIHGSIWSARMDDRDSDLVPFIGIVSETDTLPTDDTRPLWQAAALERLQPEISRLEAWAKEFGELHCRRLVERFSSGEIKLGPPALTGRGDEA